MNPQDYFTPFKKATKDIPRPERFTFPFQYVAHPLCKLAAEELQNHIESQTNWAHNFGVNNSQLPNASGKMFGVLVVENEQGELGYLSAFSGNLAGQNLLPNFVPPVFDILEKDGFFKLGEEELNQINRKVTEIDVLPEYRDLKNRYTKLKQEFDDELSGLKQAMKIAKKDRKHRRKNGNEELDSAAYDLLLSDLSRESQMEKIRLKNRTKEIEISLTRYQDKIHPFEESLKSLKDQRKAQSAKLQQQIFDQYQFLNSANETKSLCTIFEELSQSKPPAGAGDCAAPKLLQFAFRSGFRPICMAEFWYGASPKMEIRKHLNFYPACKSKCHPILSHMLEGMIIDENPVLVRGSQKKMVEIVFEDEHFALINKPANLLSVPGKSDLDSVYQQMRARYPKAEGPLIVHRLDMATSGLMLIAKSDESYKNLQEQFMSRRIKKRYIALLDGIVKQDHGFIELPLRVDLDDRPRQLVCYEHGKHAKTEWFVLNREDGKTRIQYHPITGRTHQLRVHSAHPSGLNCPIVGDDLYGTTANRLHLHAEAIVFSHPQSGKEMKFEVSAEF